MIHKFQDIGDKIFSLLTIAMIKLLSSIIIELKAKTAIIKYHLEDNLKEFLNFAFCEGKNY